MVGKQKAFASSPFLQVETILSHCLKWDILGWHFLVFYCFLLSYYNYFFILFLFFLTHSGHNISFSPKDGKMQACDKKRETTLLCTSGTQVCRVWNRRWAYLVTSAQRSLPWATHPLPPQACSKRASVGVGWNQNSQPWAEQFLYQFLSKILTWTLSRYYYFNYSLLIQIAIFLKSFPLHFMEPSTIWPPVVF